MTVFTVFAIIGLAAAITLGCSIAVWLFGKLRDGMF